MIVRRLEDILGTERDVKAANLQLLVEKVLEIDTTEVAGDTEGYENAIYDAIQLARSLKQ